MPVILSPGAKWNRFARRYGLIMLGLLVAASIGLVVIWPRMTSKVAEYQLKLQPPPPRPYAVARDKNEARILTLLWDELDAHVAHLTKSLSAYGIAERDFRYYTGPDQVERQNNANGSVFFNTIKRYGAGDIPGTVVIFVSARFSSDRALDMEKLKKGMRITREVGIRQPKLGDCDIVRDLVAAALVPRPGAPPHPADPLRDNAALREDVVQHAYQACRDQTPFDYPETGHAPTEVSVHLNYPGRKEAYISARVIGGDTLVDTLDADSAAKK